MPKYKRNDLTRDQVLAKVRYFKTSGLFRWVEHRDAWRVGQIAQRITSKGYVQIYLYGHCYLAHRLAWLVMTGSWPEEEIDHRDGDPMNNKWRNLRPASEGQQRQNIRARGNKSGYTGVYWSNRWQTWIAYITVNYRKIYLGSSRNVHEAGRIRAAGKLVHHPFYNAARDCA